MSSVSVYLTFKGNCRQAFDFYKAVFGGEFLSSSTFAEMPPQEGMPPIPEEMKNQIMHVTLPIGDTVLMGSDTGGEWAPNFQQGNNFSLSYNADSKADAERVFAALSANGHVTMPMDQTFWGSYFGMLTDSFGINWMVSFDTEEHK